MKKIIQYLAFICLILLCNSSKANKNITDVNISFTHLKTMYFGPYPVTIVVMDEVGKPISGANVFIPESGLGSVYTDETGTATFMVESEKGEMKALITTDAMTTTQIVSTSVTNTVVISSGY
jgi:hypothetical protein